MKATDITALDVSRICSFTDVIVLCTGSARTHLQAIVDEVERRMCEHGVRPLAVEGRSTGWVILDYADVVAHVFTEESRRYYNLERLWADGKVVQWRRGGRRSKTPDGPTR